MDTPRLTIVAVDPGKMTGWAQWREGAVVTGQAESAEFLTWLDEAFDAGLRPSIVCEDFIYTAQTAKKSRQTWSTESIGVLRFLARKHGVNFTLQPPVDAKKFSTNEKLKAMNWYRPTKGGHANDAARHLLLYCVKNKLIATRDLLKPEQEET